MEEGYEGDCTIQNLLLDLTFRTFKFCCLQCNLQDSVS